MFKNVSVFKITLPQPVLAFALQDAAQEHQFTPCGPTQERSVGWVPPRGQEHGAMVESIGGQLIMRLMIETRAVPAEAIKRAVDEAATKIEKREGRKPGKKERKGLADEALLSLLPNAFTKQSAVTVWIDPANGRMVASTASQALLDVVLSEIVSLGDGIRVHPLVTGLSPSSVMSTWLVNSSTGSDEKFDIGRSCDMKSCDETKSTVRYAKHPLDTDEVREHIVSGKIVTKLQLTYDGRVTFDLDAGGAMRKINFLDVVFFDRVASAEDAFDADVAILTGEFSKLIPDLIDALGGEVEGV